MLAVALHDVSHRFAAHWVLHRLTFTLAVGDRVLLTGDNGSGKTTLLRILATALRPSLGSVALFGMQAAEQTAACRRSLALMTHQHYFYEPLSAADNLALVARLRGKSAGAISGHLGDAPEHTPQSALARVGLGHVGAAPVAAFSAGMKRRLALARLLVLRPRLVLLDEPFSHLDGQGIAFVHTFLQELAASGVSWVMSTHEAQKARQLCNRHLHLRRAAAAQWRQEVDHAR